jgi:hypothetical protein
MPLWKLLKMSREILSTWRGLADEERERVREEADRVRRLMAELARHAGPLGKRITAEGEADKLEQDADQPASPRDRPPATELGGLGVHSNVADQAAGSPETPRDIKAVSAELLHAVTQLGSAIGPGAVEAAKRNSPRSLRTAAKLSSLGARKARKRWS